MSIFSQDIKSYIITTHAREQLAIRGQIDFSITPSRCRHLIKTGELLLETPNYRYVKNGNLFFPCKVEEKNTYLLPTVLLYDSMVQRRFQNIINLYDKKY